MAFQLALGHNNAAGLADLVTLPVSPGPPYTPGLKYARTIIPSSQKKYRDGLYTEWRFSFLTKAQRAAFETQAGLSEAVPWSEVTINTLTNDYTTFDTYNAIIWRPDPEDSYTMDRGKLLDVVYRLVQLEAL